MTAETPRRRGRDKRRAARKPVKLLRDYEAIERKLKRDSKLESRQATDTVVMTIVECMRHLEELRARCVDGSISSDERRVIPSLSSHIRRAVETLGLDKRKEAVIDEL